MAQLNALPWLDFVYVDDVGLDSFFFFFFFANEDPLHLMQLDYLVIQLIPVQGVSMPRVVPRSSFSSPSIGKGHTSITASTPRRFH